MLLPSDVARLVLGYLQEEGLSATTQTFIQESHNLKEYADHTTEDGIIPACVFSIFGKGLTTILNEYVAAKTKETQPEVPAMMTSLWKKLDFTLNQIKSLQNSPAIATLQRTRSRIGLANMMRQRALTAAPAVVCSTVSESSSIISPALASHSVLSHSTPVSYTRAGIGTQQQQQIQDGGRLLSTPRDSPVHVVVSEHRLNAGPMSPGRRKWDTPRKRSAALAASSVPGKSTTTGSSTSADAQPEEVIDENFPQLVIQNARDKILGDRSLQEKLAENINKILANEPVPQSSKATTSAAEPDQSIDEILGLQGEIHMSDDAIHDILEQTESDPAFQALFDLFDCSKTKFPDGDPEDGDVSSSPEESDAPGSSSAVGLVRSADPAPTHKDCSGSDTCATTSKMRVVQDRKMRKSSAPTLLKKTFLSSNGRSSRIEGSSARLLVIPGVQQTVTAAPGNSNIKERPPPLSNNFGTSPMDMDGQLHTPPPPSDRVLTPVPATNDCAFATNDLFECPTVPSAGASCTVAASEETAPSAVDGKQEDKGAQPAGIPSLGQSSESVVLSSLQDGLNNIPTSTRQVLTDSVTKFATSVTALSSSLSPSTTTLVTITSASPTLPLDPTSAALSMSSSSSAPVSIAPAPSSDISSTPSKGAGDSDNVVSLKIIISDSQDEDPSGDAALNQAISSISGDKIPTIYLSSPAKSPGTLPTPGTPRGSMDEVAQAVNGLQNSEVFASPLVGKTGALVASPLTGTSQAQQSYIIQLPLNATNSPHQGPPASYFLVTDPQTTDVQSRPMLLPAGVPQGQPLSTGHFGATTQMHSQGYSTGSALILPSPAKPLMLPVSLMGQNTLGNVQMVTNQLVALPNPVSLQQSETVKPKSFAVAPKQIQTTGTEKDLVAEVPPPVSAENTEQQDATKSSNHRRILCFESSAEIPPQTAKPAETATTSATNTSLTQPPQQPTEDNAATALRRKPAILGGNKPKRRIAIIRCPENHQTAGALVKESEKSIPTHNVNKDLTKKNPRKQHHTVFTQESQSVDSSKSDTSKKLGSRRRTKSTDRKHSLGKEEASKAKSSDVCSSKSSDSAPETGSKSEKGECSRKEPSEKAKYREGRTEKKTQETPNVTANKENENKGGAHEQLQQSMSTPPTSRNLSPPPVSQPQSKATKSLSKTSSLAKQAAEMLQDIQGLNSPSTPGKRPGAGTSEQTLPGTPCTGQNQEQSTDSPRTPSLHRNVKNGEGTPKRLLPPNTSDVPNCSPASETGSENSINMAAHTLMILSRAAIARTGTPLKDSLRQDEAGEKSPTSSKNSKKRKQSCPSDCPPSKRESKRSPSRKKDRVNSERKKLVDCFPHDLDVDKFLSSLHYDE